MSRRLPASLTLLLLTPPAPAAPVPWAMRVAPGEYLAAAEDGTEYRLDLWGGGGGWAAEDRVGRGWEAVRWEPTGRHHLRVALTRHERHGAVLLFDRRGMRPRVRPP